MGPAHCRLRPLPHREGVDIVVNEEGHAHFNGLMVCGSPWVCPVCAPIIRAKRAEEVRTLVKGLLGDGGSAVFVTATLPHDFEDKLGEMFGATSSGWGYVFSVRAWHGDSKKEAAKKLVPNLGLRGRLGYVGQVRALEVTHGANGFHPHVHALLCFDRKLSDAEVEELQAFILERWQKRIMAKGYRSPSARHGVVVELVETEDQLGQYLTKVEGLDGGRSDVGMELTGVGKTAKGTNRSPWQILWSFVETGDLADAELFRRFAEGSKGKASLFITRSLRQRYLQEEEQSDEELAVVDEGGETVARVETEAWELMLLRVRSVQARVLEAVEDGGVEQLAAYLRSLELSVVMVRAPDGVPLFVTHHRSAHVRGRRVHWERDVDRAR